MPQSDNNDCQRWELNLELSILILNPEHLIPGPYSKLLKCLPGCSPENFCSTVQLVFFSLSNFITENSDENKNSRSHLIDCIIIADSLLSNIFYSVSNEKLW